MMTTLTMPNYLRLGIGLGASSFACVAAAIMPQYLFGLKRCYSAPLQDTAKVVTKHYTFEGDFVYYNDVGVQTTVTVGTSQKIQVVHGDITKENVDAIVNAANSWLKHGGGVAAALVKAGGPIIQKESDAYVNKNGPVKTGQVAVTSAGNLSCKFLIHAVGPVWEGGSKSEESLLESAVQQSLEACHSRNVTSVALPAISSGIFGFPKEKCALVLFNTTLNFMREYSGKSSLELVRFTNFDKETVDIFKKAAAKYKDQDDIKIFHTVPMAKL